MSGVVRAIDIGYGNTKFVVDDFGHCKLFPSLAPRAASHHEHVGMYRERRTSEIWVDGQVFEVGPDTVLFSDIPILHSDYIETAEYRALLYGALEAMQVKHIDLLVTGLPVHLHESRWQRLQTLLTGAHTVKPDHIVQVDEVAVVVQPLGGFIAHNHTRGRWVAGPERTYLLVDPGYFTFDWLVTRGMQEVPGLSGSVECGVSEYLKSIEAQLNWQWGESYSNLRRLDEGLRQGHFRLKGRTIDLEPYRVQADGVVSRALRALRNKVGAGQEIDEIVLVGGGGPFFLAGLKAAFPEHPLHQVQDPVFANVRGFQLIGEALRKRKAA